MKVEHLAEGVSLYLGDSREIVPALPRPDALVTDPPYGMAFRSNFRTERHEAIANDGDEDLLLWCAGLPASHSRYIFCRWDNLASLPKARSVVTWIKNNWSMGDLDHEHARQTETICFWPGEGHFFPKGRPQDVVFAPRTGNDHHPTEKPVGLMAAVCEWTSGVIMDPFMGSGTTGVTAVRLGRPFVGVEIDARYFDTACRRISEELKRPRLRFDGPKPKPTQEALL